MFHNDFIMICFLLKPSSKHPWPHTPRGHLSGLRSDHLFLLSLCVMSFAGFVLTARHKCLSTLLFPRPLYSFLCVSVRCQTVVVFYACTDCVTHLSFVLSGSSARSCFCVSLHPHLCVQIPRASTPTPAVPGYLRTRCGRLSLSLGFASSLASFIVSAAVTARPAVVIEPSAWQRILLLSD